MEELWSQITVLLRDWVFYARVISGVLIWYVVSVALSHFVFDRGGREGVEATILACWVSLFLVLVTGVLLGLYVWSSLALAVSLGVFLFVLPVLLTLLLGRVGHTNHS